MKLTKSVINNPEIVEGYPVKGFPLKFQWYSGIWSEIFDKQIDLIQNDIARAHAEDRIIVYLSCPISSRGGGHYATNVEVANHTTRRLMEVWGEKFWILNPCQYQLESKEGTGLIKGHAKLLALEKKIEIDLEKLPRPNGGDYMRMWTKVLVEDGKDNLGEKFDVFYFLAPSDVISFFSSGGSLTITAAIEEYFSRKYTLDLDFHEEFSVDDSVEWVNKRKDFFRFYSVRASANYSRGCHDEWQIWTILNQERLKKYGIGNQISGYFENKQIIPSATEDFISKGYAI